MVDRLRTSDFQCSPCGEVFGTIKLFDAHQHWTADYASLRCEIPAGLVRDRRGVWQTPAGLARREADAERMPRPGRRARAESRSGADPGGRT